MESSLNVMNNSGSNSNAQAEEKSEDLPPGFRFHPTDEELVTYYLTKKILDGSFSGRAITEVDLNKCEPWDLPGKAKMGEKEWYFFSLRDRKYPTGLRTNRATEAGYWKTTGKDREIFNSRTSALVGMKKTLVFYKGRAPKGEKTNWVMHEYRLEGKFSYHRLPKNCKDEWVVCRIFQKNAGGKKIGATGLMSRSAYLDLPGSPSLPSLLESPYNTATAINDQETTGSIDSESGTSSKAHVSCFSTAMDYNNSTGYNFMGHHHHQLQQGSSNSETSDQLSEMARYMKFSSYMQNIMVNDPRINMNPMSAALSNLRRDNSLALPGIQNLALPPPLLFPQMPLPSTSYPNFNPSSAGMLRTLLGGQSGLLMDPSSSNFSMHDKADDKANLAANSGAIQWVNETDHHHHQQIKLEEGNVLSQSNAIQQSDGTAQCLSTDMNEEMSSVVCSQLNRSFDQVDPSSSAPPPVDLDSFWNFRDNSF